MIESFESTFSGRHLLGVLILDEPYTSLEVEEGRDWIGSRTLLYG